MKLSISRSFRWFFALIPRKCWRCDDYFWLERGIKHTNFYGETKRYCADCAPHEWEGARKEQEK
jgi:hypothetical protein